MAMDPVNPKALKGKFKDRKDKDIDNDGDTDSSDEYLHKRRAAVSKAIGKVKEAVELDELSQETLRQYHGKAGADLRAKRDKLNKGTLTSKDHKSGQNRVNGLNRAANKMEELDDLEEKNLENKSKKRDYQGTTGAEYHNKNTALRKKHGIQYPGNAKALAMGRKIARGDVKEAVAKVLDRMSEAKDKYTINHKTFSSAVQHAEDVVNKRGFEIDPEEWDRKVSMGPRKPGAGKTNSYTIALMKNGKEVKQKLQMQVYYDEGRYELNMYIS